MVDDKLPLGALTIGEFRELMKDMLESLLDDVKCSLEPLQNEADDDGNLLRSHEAEEMLGVSSTTLWRWNQKGYLKAVKIWAKVYYWMHDIRELQQRK